MTTRAERVVQGLQGLLFQVDVSQIVVHEVDDPNPLVNFLEAHALSGRGPDYGACSADAAAQFPQIIGSYVAFTPSFVQGGVAEYQVLRSTNGLNEVFLLYFLVDQDGIWRLNSM